LQVGARSSANVQVLTAVNYSEPISQAEYATWKDVVEKQAVDVSISVEFTKVVRKIRFPMIFHNEKHIYWH
jgi:hypothetical protein